jgi:hypothetical protein
MGSLVFLKQPRTLNSVRSRLTTYSLFQGEDEQSKHLSIKYSPANISEAGNG